MLPEKESPDAKTDKATGYTPKHTQDVENTEKNKPAPAASDKNNNGKPDKREGNKENKK